MLADGLKTEAMARCIAMSSSNVVQPEQVQGTADRKAPCIGSLLPHLEGTCSEAWAASAAGTTRAAAAWETSQRSIHPCCPHPSSASGAPGRARLSFKGAQPFARANCWTAQVFSRCNRWCGAVCHFSAICETSTAKIGLQLTLTFHMS